MKKKEELKPEVEQKKSTIEVNDLKEIATIMSNIPTTSDNNKDDGDTYFRNALNKLFDEDNIELKTEYINVLENFTGAKLTFLARYGNMPYLDKFVDIFERKRVSLERKGRQEIILALKERSEEIKRDGQTALRNLFGIQQ